MSESRKAARSSRRRIEPLFKSVAPGGAGAMPGSPIYIGDKVPTEAALSLIQYDATDISFVTPEHIEEVFAMLEDGMVNWINVNGLGDQDAIKRLAGYYRLDPLTVEDILNTEHRPKLEDFGHYILLITKMLTKRDDDSIEYEQVSIIITRNSVLTIQESPGDCFDPIRERLRAGLGRLRRTGASYLGYALLDIIVDRYFTVLEWLGLQLEDLESGATLARQSGKFMDTLQAIKSDLNRFRRIVWPVRETISVLLHSDSDLIDGTLEPFLRDLQENSVQVIEALESYRETATGIHEVFMSSVSNRMNEVMKVLTIISTIFIPLTFIAGVYGMNFRFMPELVQPWGYPAVLGLMLVTALGMIIYFKRKHWF